MDCEQRGGCFGENRDRYLLVVDEAHDHMFLTARTYPKMVLIESEAIDNTLKVRFPGIFGEVQVDLESAVARGDVRQGRWVYYFHSHERSINGEMGQFRFSFHPLS